MYNVYGGIIACIPVFGVSLAQNTRKSIEYYRIGSWYCIKNLYNACFIAEVVLYNLILYYRSGTMKGDFLFLLFPGGYSRYIGDIGTYYTTVILMG